MFRPTSLQSGDRVALISPAGFIDPADIEYAIKVLKSWELQTVLGKHLYKRSGFFAGTDAERMEDLQWAMDDENIRAIFCTRGGYGCMRIVERLDYSFFQGAPKWLVGFSDITVLHTKMTSLGVESLHAPMPKSYPKTSAQALSQLKAFLFGKISNYTLPPHDLNKPGLVRGELTGGNLSLIHCMRSTSIEHHSHHAILFIEDVHENLYAIDRMIQTLKLSGRLAELQGLIVGQFSEMRGENFGKNAYEIIREAVDDYSYPVCFGFPAGHVENNHPLILGSKIELSVEEKSEIIFI